MKIKKGKKIILITAVILIALIVFGIFAKIYFSNAKEKFQVDTLFLKVSINPEGVSSNNINIVNNDIKKHHFSVVLKNLEIGEIENPEFDLNPGEENNFKIIFRTNNKTSGIYPGLLEITSEEETKKIPVIIEVHSDEVLFSSNINVFPQGKDIVLGEKLNMEIKIFDLANIGRNNVKISYFIKNFEGKTIIFESEELVVDGKRYDYSKSFDLANANQGEYIFGIITEYKNSVGTSSTLFKIVEKSDSINYGSPVLWIIGIFVFFMALFFMLFAYSFFYKDRLLNELKNQYKIELRNQREILKKAEKREFLKLKGKTEKKLYKREIRKVRKKRIKAISEIHKKRIHEYKRMRKKGHNNQLKKQVEKWQKQGYDTSVLDKKYKMPDARAIRQKINKWQKQGYDTSVLER